jgi:hypothetical protein
LPVPPAEEVPAEEQVTVYANEKFGFRVSYSDAWELFDEDDRGKNLIMWFWHRNNTLGKFPLAEPPLWGAYVFISARSEAIATTLEELKDVRVVSLHDTVVYEGPTRLAGKSAWERIVRSAPSFGTADGINFTSYAVYHEIFTLHKGGEYEIEFFVAYSYPQGHIPPNPYEMIEKELKEFTHFDEFLQSFEFI